MPRALPLMIALGAVLLIAPSARAADPDPWIAKDKALHFGVSASIAISGYGIGAYAFDARAHALLLGGGLAAGAGIVKESLDLAGYGTPSWKDVAWDGIGIATGLALAWGLDLLIRGVSPRHPLLASPAR
jgi:putative lipoprotein